MTETDNSAGFVESAAGEGGTDEDPGPRPLNLFFETEDWQSIEGVEPMLRRAYLACVDADGEIENREVSIMLSDDAHIADLNAQYRGKAKPTNVLSFPAAEAPAGIPVKEHPPLGDIIIAYETVMREAAEEGKPVLSHLAHLAVHGILHLAGFDHETDEDAEHMEEMERQILASLDIPDPYSTSTEEQSVIAG